MSATALNPAALNQLLALRASQAVASQLPEISGLVSVTGVLADPGKARGQWHYGVRLKDDGGQVLVDLPVSMVAGKRLQAGHRVSVTGVVRIRAGAHAGSLEMRIEASAVEFAADREAEVPPSKLADIPFTPDTLPLPAGRGSRKRSFPIPAGRVWRIALIQSSSRAQVVEDCMSEIEKLGALVRVDHIGANMREAGSIVAALARAHGDIVMMIRGGGDEHEFEVFDDPRVVEALAAHPSYRVIGLGHSANHTHLDLIAEHSARTPGQAGAYVREAISRAIAGKLPPNTGIRMPARNGNTDGDRHVHEDSWDATDSLSDLAPKLMAPAIGVSVMVLWAWLLTLITGASPH